MISFLYTGEYHVNTKSEDNPIPSGEQFRNEADSYLQPCSGPESLKNETIENILSHLRVNAIADYYNGENLAQLANSKIKAILEQGQEANLFPRVIQEMPKSNRAAELCAIIASATADCMDELMMLRDFQDVELEHTLVFEMIRALTTKIKEVQNRLEDYQQLAASYESLAIDESEINELFRES
jgi:hypothetical protein